MPPLVYRAPVAIGLFNATVLVWWISELRIMVRNRGGTGENLDRGSRLLVVGLVALGIATAFGVAWQRLGRIDGWWPVVAGLVLAGAGMALRAWAVASLGTFFTTAVEVQPDHRIVESGPYRRLRHPSYTGALLTVGGVSLALGTWLGCVVATLCALAGIVPRILVEERALATRLGHSWHAFARGRRRLLPLIW